VPHKKILEEHVHLRVLCDRLRLIAAAPGSTLPQARWRKVLDHELGSLLDSIESHFQTEERGGYLRNLVGAHPELGTRAEELLSQHGAILRGLEEAYASVQQYAAIDALRPQLRTLLATVAAHESNETELIQEALQRDTGAGD